MKIKFMEGAWTDYLSWQSDKAMLRKINRLIQDIQRSPFEGLTSRLPILAYQGWSSRTMKAPSRIWFLSMKYQSRATIFHGSSKPRRPTQVRPVVRHQPLQCDVKRAAVALPESFMGVTLPQ